MLKIKNFFIKIWNWIKEHCKTWCVFILHFEIGKISNLRDKLNKTETKTELNTETTETTDEAK